MKKKLTETRLIEYLGFITPDKSLSNFEFCQEFSKSGYQLQHEHKNLLLDIVFDDSTGGLKRPRISKPESNNENTNIYDFNDNEIDKEYKFVHFTTTDQEGINQFITLIMFHVDDSSQRISRLETLINQSHSEFESASKNPFGTRMRTFF